MLRTSNPQPSLWEAILPEPCLGLPTELARVDALLDAPVFWEPFRAHFDPIIGRPSIPIETYLRMMFLKFRYRLGYELLCREVADSISWQRFCRIPLGGQVPHATTLVKLTRRVGPAVVDQLNETLLTKAATHKVLRTHKVRVDTTVVEANVAYPTDAGLLTKAITTLARTVERVRAAGGATRTHTRDRRRAAHRRAHQLARSLRARTDQARQLVAERTTELAALAEQAVADAGRVARTTRRGLTRSGSQASGKLTRLVADLETTIQRTGQVINQTRTRLAGTTPDGATRLVSLPDPDARPIVKGRLGKPVEFGSRPRSPTIPTDRARLPAPGRQPGGCAPAGPSSQADHGSGWPGAAGGDRRPQLWRGQGRRRPRRAGRHPGRDPTKGHPRRRPPGPRAHPKLPAAGEVAHRLGGTDQPPQTPLRLGLHPDGRHRRRSDLVWAWGLSPQPGQDQRPGRRKAAAAGGVSITQTKPDTEAPVTPSTQTSSGRSN